MKRFTLAALVALGLSILALPAVAATPAHAAD